MSAALIVRLVFWLWFAAAVAAGHQLVFQRLPPYALPLALLALSGTLVAVVARLAGVRAWAAAVDLRPLILLHLSRLAGLYFVVLYQRGELPRTLAFPGGMGEIAVAVMTLPVVFAPLAPASRLRAIRIWNIVGIIEIVLLVFTVTRLNLASPNLLRPLTQLPLSLYATFLLPLLIASHFIIFRRTAEPRRPD